MTRKYLFVIKKERNDGDYDLVYLDYKVIEGTNRSELIKKAEKLLKQKVKKEGIIHSALEEKIDLINVDIIQIVI